MLVEIKFTKNGCCSALGNFAPGDLARVPQDLADHLVNEAGCARYAAAAAPAAAPAGAQATEPEIVTKVFGKLRRSKK